MKSNIKRSTSILISLVGVSAVISVTSLRNNSKNAQVRYEALIEADKNGEGVEEALNELRSYIYAHMNTDIGSDNGIYPPIQLQGTYARLITDEQARVKEINDTVYEKAQKTCEARFGAGSLRNGRVQCVEDYVEENSVVASTVSADLYKFDFQPPVWSPDIAGFSLLSTILIGTIVIFRTVHYLIKKSL